VPAHRGRIEDADRVGGSHGGGTRDVSANMGALSEWA
jgi:hypothetical protein